MAADVYELFGIAIASDRRLPGLVPSLSESADLVVRTGGWSGSVARLFDAAGRIWYRSDRQLADGRPSLQIDRLAGGAFYRMRFDEDLLFLCNGRGERVYARWGERVGDGLSLLAGPVLGFALRLRGVTCLHAGAVAVGRGALVFTGRSGAGKSTLVAEFVKGGCRMMSDDIVPVKLGEAGPVVHSGYPRLKLWPDSADWFQDRLGGSSPVASYTAKGYVQPSGAESFFQAGERKLLAAFILEPNRDARATPCLESLQPSAALPLLAANTYAADLVDKDRRRREFEVLAHLVNRVPVKRLSFRPGFTDLGTLRRLVLGDLDQG